MGCEQREKPFGIDLAERVKKHVLENTDEFVEVVVRNARWLACLAIKSEAFPSKDYWIGVFVRAEAAMMTENELDALIGRVLPSTRYTEEEYQNVLENLKLVAGVRKKSVLEES